MFGRFFATFFELLVNSFVASSFILKVKDCYMDIYLCNVQVNAWIMKSYFYPLEDNKILCRKVIYGYYIRILVVIIFLMLLTMY